MRLLFALAIGALALDASAQTNLFQIYPPATTYTSRGTLSVNAGEFLQEVPAAYFAGVGDSGTACTAAGMIYATQDQLGTTLETYSVVLRKEAMGGGPDISATGAISVSGPYTTPANTTAGPIAWTVTLTYTTPVTLPCLSTYFMGLQLAAAPGWTMTPADGQSIHVAYYSTVAPAPVTGDNPRPGAPNHAWVNNMTLMTASISNPGQVLNVGVSVSTPVLNMGNVDPLSTRSPGGVSYGAGGIYPKSIDGVSARVRDAANNGGNAFLLIGVGLLPVGLPLSGFTGSIYLNPSGPIIGAGSASIVNNEAMLTVLAPGALPQGIFGTVFFQAITATTAFGNARFSNAAGMNF